MINAKLYDAVWRVVRANQYRHRAFSDEGMWHRVYETYRANLPYAEPSDDRDTIIEAHLRIVGDIAGQIVWKRTPHSFGIWKKETMPSKSHVALVREVAAFGVLGLFIAVDRFDPAHNTAFSTYASYWIKKLCRLYLEEIIPIYPRTGHMGIKEQGDGACGPWAVYKPRRGVMDLFDAALAGVKLYRGKAAGGMAMFDQSLVIPGKNPGDKDIETVGSDGPTLNPGLGYLQRRVTYRRYPWNDMGAGSVPRYELPGHQGGKASDLPAEEASYEIEEDERAVALKRAVALLPPTNRPYVGYQWPLVGLGETTQGSYPARDTRYYEYLHRWHGWHGYTKGLRWLKPAYEEQHYEEHEREVELLCA
jgi:hypothetical protein